MAIGIDWATKTFSVPQADLTLVTGTLYSMDTETYFRAGVNAILASEDGIVFQPAINHNTQITVAGVIYARTISVVNGYSVTFTPDAQWSVVLSGSNNDIWDIEAGILNQNQVQVIPNNSGGLIVSESGVSGLTPTESADLAQLATDQTAIVAGQAVIAADVAVIEGDHAFIRAVEGGRWDIDGSTLTFYDTDNTTPIAEFELRDAAGVPTTNPANVFERVRTGP